MNKYTYVINDNIIKLVNTEKGTEINITSEQIEKFTEEEHFAANVRDYIIHTIKTLEKIKDDLENLYLSEVYKEPEELRPWVKKD